MLVDAEDEGGGELSWVVGGGSVSMAGKARLRTLMLQSHVYPGG